MNNTFDFNKISNFDKHINMSIPNYDELIDQIIQISEYVIDKNTNVYDIGCSTGRLFSMMDTADQDISYIGIDNSVLIHSGTPTDNVNFISSDIVDCDMDNASFITSIFTLQFLSRKKRAQVIRNMASALNTNGIAIICEKTYSKNSMVQDITNSIYYEFKQQSFTDVEILNKDRQLRSAFKLNTVDQLIHELSAIGDVDIFWRRYNFVGFIVTKRG